MEVVLMFLQTERIDKQHNWKIEVWRWSSLTFYLESEIDLHKQAGVDPKIVTLNSFIVAWWYVVIIQTFALFFYFRFYFHLNNFSRYVIQQIHLPNISTWMNTMTATFQLASLTTRQIRFYSLVYWPPYSTVRSARRSKCLEIPTNALQMQRYPFCFTKPTNTWKSFLVVYTLSLMCQGKENWTFTCA